MQLQNPLAMQRMKRLEKSAAVWVCRDDEEFPMPSLTTLAQEGGCAGAGGRAGEVEQVSGCAPTLLADLHFTPAVREAGRLGGSQVGWSRDSADPLIPVLPRPQRRGRWGVWGGGFCGGPHAQCTCSVCHRLLVRGRQGEWAASQD
jgi:hypothetical protein